MAKNKPQIKTIPRQPVAPTAKIVQPKNKKSSGNLFKLPESQNKTMLFGKLNYILIIIAVLIITLGFVLMSGGNTNPKVFNEAEIYSFRRITLAPITILVGFVLVAVAILLKPSTEKEN